MTAPEKTIIPFINQSVTTIGVGSNMRSMYGQVPAVEVMYWDGEKYNAAGIFTDIRLIVENTGYEASTPAHPGAPARPPVVSAIKINHGGPSIGIVKIG